MIKNIHLRTFLVTDTGEEKDEIRTESDGTWQHIASRHVLRFQDPANQGDTYVLLESSTAHIRRKGVVTSKMHFEVGRKAHAYYRIDSTPLRMTVRTHSLRLETAEESGYLEMKYTLYVSGAEASHNFLRIEWQQI